MVDRDAERRLSRACRSPLLILARAWPSALALGAINGLLVWKLDIPPIVVTLGTLTIYRGMIFVISGGAWVNAHQMSAGLHGLPRADAPRPAGAQLDRDPRDRRRHGS